MNIENARNYDDLDFVKFSARNSKGSVRNTIISTHNQSREARSISPLYNYDKTLSTMTHEQQMSKYSP